MKAPNKIYLGIQDLGSGYVYNLSLDNNGEQEYIRKDALLEWLNERIKCGEDEGLMSNYMADLAYKDVIEKIESL